MRRLGFVCILSLISLSAFAAEEAKLGFHCKTKQPTTSFALTEDGEDVVLKVTHHNGVGYMPIHEGIIVPNDIGYLKHKADVMTRLGPVQEFRFPKKKCIQYSPGVMACRSGERRDIDGMDVEALHFLTSKDTRQVFDEKVDYYRAELSLNIQGEPPVKEITMMYATDECVFGE
jgi:hypothetical protein